MIIKAIRVSQTKNSMPSGQALSLSMYANPHNQTTVTEWSEPRFKLQDPITILLLSKKFYPSFCKKKVTVLLTFFKQY